MTAPANKSYQPQNVCIYCRSADTERLSDEHIVPFALGGNLVLPRSSCQDCARITGQFEQLVLRGGLRGIKERLRLSTRTKDRPKKLPLFAINGDETAKAYIDIDDYPAIVILPHFLGPEIARFPNAPVVSKLPWLFTPPLDVARLHEKYGIKSWASNSLDTFSFGRMLCKIGHSFAIAERGLDTFVSYLQPDILQSRDANFLKFIGTIETEHKPFEGDLVHKLEIADEIVDGMRYLVSYIQLFANFGAPAYRVVVGQTIADFNPLLQVAGSVSSQPTRTAEYRLIVSSAPEANGTWFPIPDAPVWLKP